jgi:hypothetical protein
VTSVGEEILGRKLRRERRAGVEHYAPGQHGAVEDEDCPGVFLLSYVDQMGHAVVIPCEREGGSWGTAGLAIRAGQVSVETRQLREDFELSEKMVAALDRAAGRT